MPDITDTLAPKSDQLDAVDLVGGPRTFTITDVHVTGGDQPVSMRLAEFPRVYRPNKSMRRVIVACWNADTDAYIGRRLTLFCDPKVEWGGKEVGGIRVSHLSHIDAPKKVPLLISKTKSEMYRVDPLPDAPAPLADSAIACSLDVEQLKAWWREFPGQRAAIESRVADLKAADEVGAAGAEGGGHA